MRFIILVKATARHSRNQSCRAVAKAQRWHERDTNAPKLVQKIKLWRVSAAKDSEAGAMPSQELLTAMADYHEQLASAGVLLDGNGLHPSSKGWRIRYSGGKGAVIDGPFTETKELVAGYTIIQARSPEEALEWAKRMPNPHNEDGEIEIRQLFVLDDFGPGEAVDRFRELGMAQQK